MKRFSHRTDLTDVIDDFILLTEDRIDQDLVMRANEQRVTATAVVDTRFLTLPNRFYKMRSITITRESDPDDETEGYTHPCLYRAPQVLNESVRNTRGRPQYFTVTSQLEFDRPFDLAYTIEMSLFSRLTPLTSVNTVNNVLANYPTLYLYGCLLFLHLWEKDDEGVMKYETLFTAALNRANRQEKRGRYGPAPRMATMGATP